MCSGKTGKGGWQLKHMRILVGFALALSCLLTASIASAKPADGSAFLPEYAENSHQIVSQMEASRLVALRYARVFLSEPKAVLTYFRNELTLVTLDAPMEAQVYRLDADGHIVTEMRMLRTGTRVFANRAGYPVLEFGTGNPLTSELPPPDKPRPMTSNQTTQASDAQQSSANGQNAANGNTTDQSNPLTGQTTPSPAPNQPLAPTEPGSTAVAQTPPATTPTSEVAGVQMSTGGGGGFGSWLIPAGLAGAVAAFSGGGGRGTSAAGGGDGDGGADAPIVPEPTSFMALGAGFVALGGLISRRRRQ